MKYILIWLLPFILFCICGYDVIRVVWIYFFGEGKIERMNGVAYLFMVAFHVPAFIIATIVAGIITICIKRKKSSHNI